MTQSQTLCCNGFVRENQNPETGERIFYPSHGRPGPAHLENIGFPGLAWCGVKSQFRHVTRPGDRSEVTCKGCLRAMAKNQPKSYKG